MAKKNKSFLGFEKTAMKRGDFVKTYVTRTGRKINYAFDLRGKDISKLSIGLAYISLLKHFSKLMTSLLL